MCFVCLFVLVKGAAFSLCEVFIQEGGQLVPLVWIHRSSLPLCSPPPTLSLVPKSLGCLLRDLQALDTECQRSSSNTPAIMTLPRSSPRKTKLLLLPCHVHPTNLPMAHVAQLCISPLALEIISLSDGSENAACP